MRYDCLMIDDEKLLADSTAEYFNLCGVRTAAVYSASECRSFLRENTAELLLLDINLGDGSGFALCKELREKTDVPILFISARTSDDDKIVALHIGGDDYVQKPYSLSVLLAKVKVVLKRYEQSRNRERQDAFGTEGHSAEGRSVCADYGGSAAERMEEAFGIQEQYCEGSPARKAGGFSGGATGEMYGSSGGQKQYCVSTAGNAGASGSSAAGEMGGSSGGQKQYYGRNAAVQYSNGRLTVDFPAKQVLVDGKYVRLTSLEFKLLAYLVRNENRVISKQELFENVWEDRFTGDGTLNVHIRKLREAIEREPGRPEYIITVWGDGYRFCGRK